MKCMIHPCETCYWSGHVTDSVCDPGWPGQRHLNKKAGFWYANSGQSSSSMYYRTFVLSMNHARSGRHASAYCIAEAWVKLLHFTHINDTSDFLYLQLQSFKSEKVSRRKHTFFTCSCSHPNIATTPPLSAWHCAALMPPAAVLLLSRSCCVHGCNCMGLTSEALHGRPAVLQSQRLQNQPQSLQRPYDAARGELPQIRTCLRSAAIAAICCFGDTQRRYTPLLPLCFARRMLTPC